MKINFADYDFSEFIIKEGVFNGKTARLIIPSDLGCKFTQKNKIFRSSIWDLEGNLLSASFPKFVNWGENPENFPIPANLNKCKFVNKIDGSTLIIDCIDGRLSMRTRGVFTHETHENAAEFDFILKKYPDIEYFIREHFVDVSILFEIVSPNQRIVLSYGDEPDVYLIGAVRKENYELFTQDSLDAMATLMKVKRPTYYQFPSFEKMLELMKENKEIEGVCVYSNEDQEIHKCKTMNYLALHRLKSALSSLDKVIDLYLLQKRPSSADFYNFIEKTFDFEIAEMSRPNIEKCCVLGECSKKTLDEITQFVLGLDKSSKKECALTIIAKYRLAGLDSFAFSILNGKNIEDRDFKRLMENLDK